MPTPPGSAHPVAGLRRRLPRFPSRMFWTFSDQALSSVTNAALAIVVARSVDSERFGAFALALVRVDGLTSTTFPHTAALLLSE